jgi:hypothetical protein
MSKSNPELITTKEASDILGEGVRKTIRRVESGALKPAMKLPGLRGSYLFDRPDVEALAEGGDAE